MLKIRHPESDVDETGVYKSQVTAEARVQDVGDFKTEKPKKT